jgi:large subunit ribosomal protein L6
MSRIGKAVITVPKEATVTLDKSQVTVKGPKGELHLAIPYGLSMKIEGDQLVVERLNNDKPKRALHGYMRASVFNAIVGVTKGWTKTLELAGVGYRASLSGVNLVLSVGFSHQVTIVPPAGISFTTAEGKIVVVGIDKQAVGQMAAIIRDVKPPEPYKGKGIKYENEHIRKKAGKAKAVGSAPGGAK